MIFGEWLTNWYDVYKKPRITRAGQIPIETCIRLHIPKELKATELAALKVFDIDRAISALRPSRTQKLLHDTICAALNKAFRLELIDRDIAKLVEPVRYRVKQGRALTHTEIEVFLQRIKGHKLENLFKFYLLSGCRRHEALTITWDDVDTVARKILIRGTKTTQSFRIIPLSAELKRLLAQMPKGRRKSARLFPFNDDYATKAFRKFCPQHKLHDLRHTFATLCAESNVHPSACQRMLGHSKIDMTMRVYTHVSGAFVFDETKKLNILSKTKAKKR